eukprot:CAMPEP_0194364706 /NCGR_PEP_ID=MMETSP0174-20130528/12607_1 /TAXON_ID=216777 /ORGANISM="Proboscia alata, Strain PI-D3" /LENGTH=336 /DNA_ID=CAMNT_0039138877 /DNA_START=231 /DNA_END=1238 /DNA_ORIENTATION=-
MQQTKISLSPIEATFINYSHKDELFHVSNLFEVDLADEHKVSFLKFDTQCVIGTIQSITLKLPVAGSSGNGGSISKTEINWNSEDIDWETAPPAVGSIVPIGEVRSNTVKEVNVPANFWNSITFGQSIALRIDPVSEDGADYFKDGTQLEVTYQGTPSIEKNPSCVFPDVPVQNLEVTEMSPSFVNEEQSSASGDYFQTKLYWEEGYRWQGKKKEKRFCAYCKGDCKDEGLKLQICDDREDGQFWRWNGDKLESKKAPGYCASGSRSQRTKRCSSATKIMGFLTPPNPNKFQWHPLGNDGKCVTNPHHPRENEHLYFADCNSARRDETVYWVTGKW